MIDLDFDYGEQVRGKTLCAFQFAALPMIISTVASAASTVATVMSGIQQGKAADAAAEQSKLNARAAAQDSRAETAAIQARARAVAGASGIDPVIGSPLEIMLQNAKDAELKAQRIVWEGNQQARQYKYQAGQARTGAIMSGIAGGLKTGGGILGELYKNSDSSTYAPGTYMYGKKDPWA